MSQNSKYIHKSHNGTILLCHFVSNAKYRRVVVTDSVDIVGICDDIENCYEVNFLGIGTDKNHVHFLIQSFFCIKKTWTILKSIVTREVFKRCPEFKNVAVQWQAIHLQSALSLL